MTSQAKANIYEKVEDNLTQSDYVYTTVELCYVLVYICVRVVVYAICVLTPVPNNQYYTDLLCIYIHLFLDLQTCIALIAIRADRATTLRFIEQLCAL